jgi:hypothetical protein
MTPIRAAVARRINFQGIDIIALIEIVSAAIERFGSTCAIVRRNIFRHLRMPAQATPLKTAWRYHGTSFQINQMRARRKSVARAGARNTR